MEFNARMLATAEKLIVKYGAQITLYQPAPSPEYESGTHRPYWMVNGVKSYVEPQPVSYSGYAAVKSPQSYELLDGRIRSTDIVFECVRIPEPSTRDVIKWVTRKFNVIHVTPIVVQDAKIMYRVFARAQ